MIKTIWKEDQEREGPDYWYSIQKPGLKTGRGVLVEVRFPTKPKSGYLLNSLWDSVFGGVGLSQRTCRVKKSQAKLPEGRAQVKTELQLNCGLKEGQAPPDWSKVTQGTLC